MIRSHIHRAVPELSRTVGFAGPVSREQNPVAHGGVCTIDTCRCGAQRKTNHNAGQIERGSWYEPARAKD